MDTRARTAPNLGSCLALSFVVIGRAMCFFPLQDHPQLLSGCVGLTQRWRLHPSLPSVSPGKLSKDAFPCFGLWT